MSRLDERVDRLEEALMKLAYAQFNTEMELRQLSREMKDFKDEMRAFKDEMKDFKDEMLAFKGEMKDFKDEMLVFKGEMKDFKDEMLAFKGEMKDFKDEMLAFKDEMKGFKDGVEAFKGEMQMFKDGVEAFKGEMKAFKDEMQAFKEEVRRDRKAMNKRWGEIANKLGTVVEDIIYPSARRVARAFFGAETIEFEGQRIVRRLSGDRGRSREFDGVFAWEGHVLLLEGKAAIRPEYLRGFVDFVRLGAFFDWFPEYRGRRLIPVFGALAIPDQDVAWLTRRRIYVLKMGEEAMELVNFEAVEGERAG